MKTPEQILSDADIRLRITAEGNHKALCPKCSHTRKKKRDKCLSVKIGTEGIQWNCHNDGCNFSGGEYYDGTSKSGSFGVFGKKKAGPRDSDKFGSLQRQNKHKWRRGSSISV